MWLKGGLGGVCATAAATTVFGSLCALHVSVCVLSACNGDPVLSQFGVFRTSRYPSAARCATCCWDHHATICIAAAAAAPAQSR